MFKLAFWFGVHLVVIILEINHVIGMGNSDTYLFESPDQCEATERFDVESLKCKLCDPLSLLVPSDDRLFCVCNAIAIQTNDSNWAQQQPICMIQCRSNVTDKNCLPASEVQAMRSMCSLKVVNFTSNKLDSKFLNIFPLNDSKCQCNEKTQSRFGQICIPNIFLKEFNRLANFESLKDYQHLNVFTFACQFLRNRTACQYMANLCVLVKYSLHPDSPCHLFYPLQKTDLRNDDEQTTNIRRMLFFNRGKVAVEMLKQELDYSYEMDAAGAEASKIQFTLISLTLSGGFDEHKAFTISDLNFCDPLSTKTIQFGRSLVHRCQLKISDLAKTNRNTFKFSSLYLNYVENSLPIMKSVPILLKNEMFNDREMDLSQSQLVKRFFIVDILSKIPSLFSAVPVNKTNLDYTNVSYIKSVELKFRIFLNNNRISIPLLIISYGMLGNSKSKELAADAVHQRLVDFQFLVTFEKADMTSDSFQEITMPLLFVLAFIGSIFRTMCQKTRQNKTLYDLNLLAYFFLNFCSCIANSLFVTATFISLHSFFVFKTQRTVRILFPSGQENAIELFIYVALALKSLKVFEYLFGLTSVDIFFIDWERPKIYDTHLINVARHTFDSHSSLKQNNASESISAWRNYFIANEWQELATIRKISWFLFLVALICLFEVMGFKNWASFEFFLHLDDRFRPDNPLSHQNKTVLLFSVGIIIYTMTYVACRIINWAIQECCIKNSIRQFVDICSIANISVLVLWEKTFGYYIHGRSPHGFADIDMCTMVQQFRREENNMCGHRGLIPGSDGQTYTILVPTNLRQFYNKLIQSLEQTNMQKAGFNATPGYSRKSNEDLNMERTTFAYNSINRFFSAFIDHELKDLDYIVKEKTVFESVFDCELQSNISSSRGVFYIDNGHSFDRVLFYGNENFLFQFEVMLFSVLLVSTENFLISTVTVGCGFKFIEMVFKTLMARNLAKKTIIDERFLM